jgi:hypothetical protein
MEAHLERMVLDMETTSLLRPPSYKAAPPLAKRLAEFGLLHRLTFEYQTDPQPKELLTLKMGLVLGSEFFVDTQLPGPANGLPYKSVRVLPPSPLRHVTHVEPFAL